jgi:hypothetical protein
MDVRFSPFNTWYRIDSFWEGSFMERTVPGTFKRTIGAHNEATKVDAHNVKTLFNHGQDLFIGQKLLGDIDELAEDPDSPRSTVWLWDTSYNRDLLPGLRSGAYGSSFMFRVIKEEWNEEPGSLGLQPRRPARADHQGGSAVRGRTGHLAGVSDRHRRHALHLGHRHLLRTSGAAGPPAGRRLRSRLLALRSAGPAPMGTPTDPGLAAETPTDSAQRHSGGLTPAQRRERLFPTLKGQRP